jgi:hypothetical protein
MQSDTNLGLLQQLGVIPAPSRAARSYWAHLGNMDAHKRGRTRIRISFLRLSAFVRVQYVIMGASGETYKHFRAIG